MTDFTNENKLLNSRSELLHSISPNLEGDRLIKKKKIKNDLYHNLQVACYKYIVANMIEHNIFPSSFEGGMNDMVIQYAKQIIGMTSVTPNGVIRPKKETLSEFNSIQNALALILDDAQIKAKKCRVPLSIRIVTSDDDPKILERPRSNHKLHSDFWTGAVCDFAILLPVFGTLDTIDVAFGEAQGFDESFLQEVTNYSDGRKLYKNFLEYKTRMELGSMFFQDIFCLHGTRRTGKGARVSIDFTLQSEEYDDTIRPYYSNQQIDSDNHIDYEECLKVGRDSFIIEKESIADLKKSNDYDKISLVKGDAAAIKHQTSRTLRLIDMNTFEDILEFVR